VLKPFLFYFFSVKTVDKEYGEWGHGAAMQHTMIVKINEIIEIDSPTSANKLILFTSVSTQPAEH